jgi:uncharacterized protein (DUF302 family)
MKYGLKVEVPVTYERAVARAREELAKEGFGVLTEIDVRQTLKAKLDVDFRPYVILGACNPPLAHRALSAEVDVGLLLVAAIDPVEQLGITGRSDMESLAGEVRARLDRVLEGVGADGR